MLVLPLVGLTQPVFAVDLAMPRIIRGDQVTFAVSGATPGDEVLLAMGKAGAGPCPGPIDPLCLDVRSPKLLGSAVAAADGTAEIVLSVPGTAPLVVRAFQVVSTGAVPDKSPAYDAQVWDARSTSFTVYDADDLAVLEVTARIEGGLSFSAWAGEALVADLPGLVQVDAISFAADCGLAALNLPALVDLPGGISGLYCDTVTAVRAEALETSGPILIASTSLQQLVLASLTDAGGGIDLDTRALRSLDLGSLRSATALSVAGSSLTQLHLPQLTGATDISVSTSPDLEVITLPLHTEGELALAALRSLHTLDAPLLDSATRVVLFNVGLPELSLPALTTAGELDLQGNASLSTLTVPLLAPAPGSDATFRANPALPDCEIEATFSTWDGFTCTDNLADSCTNAGDPGGCT